jgi:hypothetical protein
MTTKNRNDLETFFRENQDGRQIWKWENYFEVYDRHFSRFRGKEVYVVEIGVYQGGSLRMWKNYFGSRGMICGVDINSECKAFEEEQITIKIGSQEDRQFLRRLADELPRIDILIDDGGHRMNQQITTFEELYPRISADGVYLCEDTGTSYSLSYGGGYLRKSSFIEHTKGLIDQLNAWHAPPYSRLAPNEFTRSAFGIHYYNGVTVIEKRQINPPIAYKVGQATLPDEGFQLFPESRFRLVRLLKAAAKSLWRRS